MVKKIIKGVFAMLCLGSLIGFLYMTDMTEVLAQIRSIGYGFVGVFLFSVMAHVFGTAAWQASFSKVDSIRILPLFVIRVIGENITLFNPTNLIAGETSKYQLLKKMNVSQNEGLNSIMFSRIFLIASHIFLIMVCLSWVAFEVGFIFQFGIIVMIISIIPLVLKLFLNSISDRKKINWKIKKYKTIRSVVVYARRCQIAFFRFVKMKPKAVVAVFVFSVMHWICGAGEIFIILKCLNVSIGIFDCIVVDMGVVLVKSVGGFVPGQVGVEELGTKWMLEYSGVAGGIWIAVSILRRAKQLLWILIAFLCYAVYKNITSSKINSNGHIIYNA